MSDEQADRLPNIIFIMADDMGYGDPGCYNPESKIPTPNMDRLAAEGMRLTDAHSASAVCTPSRYAVLTGRYCWRTRLQSWVLGGMGKPLIADDRLTVPRMLRRHGYATAAVGKWHLGLGWQTRDGEEPRDDGWNVDYEKPILDGPTTRGFDYFFGITASLDMPPYCFIENDRTVGVPTVEKSRYNPQQRKGLMTSGWRDEEVDTTFCEKAVGWMERQVRERPDSPFFLYLTPSAPHRPCVPPEFMVGASEGGPRGDMVCVVDWMVGRVMDALERLSVADETLLVVTSDNGARLECYDGKTYGHKSCGDLRGQKADIWDGGHREPFIARWPGRIPAGQASDGLVCLGDLMATCAAIVGQGLPSDAGEDSVNMLPVLTGGESQREALVHHSGDGMFSVRRGRWKLIDGLGSGGFSSPRRAEAGPGEPPGQLYDLQEDPAESRNLWADRPEVVRELRELLERCRREG